MNDLMGGILNHQEGYGALSVAAIILCLSATFLMSHATAWVYLRTQRGVSYSGTLARSLIILSLIVALVMLVIGNNIARAFGLFGALALIRFRTPVKDTNDTVFLFFAVAIGIANGTGNVLAGALGTLLICGVLLYLSSVRFGSPLGHDGLLRFHLPVGQPQDEAVARALKQNCDWFNLLHIRESDDGAFNEHSYQINMFDVGSSSLMVSEIERISGVSQLSLLIQDLEATP